MSRYWPFTEKAILQNLREASDSQVKYRDFRETYFPSPGCIIEGLTFEHGTAAKPLVSIEKLTIQGSYAGLLLRRISKIVAEGMQVSIPPFGTGTAFHTASSKITIGEIIANGAQIEFVSRDPAKQPLRFDVHEAFLGNVGSNEALKYRVKVHNPEPPGEVTASGKFGAWNRNNVGETPISGQYSFERADLGKYDGIAGTLSSHGKFDGTLAHIDISGETEVPDFEVTSSGHRILLRTTFSAYVDATHGDTFLKRVEADFLKTRVVADGSIARSTKGPGKTAIINLTSNQARIEDILFMFVTAKTAPMSGSTTFKAQVEIPPGTQQFLKKVKLRGAFGVGGGTFSDNETQQDVNKLSAGARGEKNSHDPGTVLTELQGSEELVNGTAHFSDLSFRVSGVHARVHGTYNLINEQIDLRGQMRVNTEISNTQSGVKSALLKVIQPFFKRKKKGQILPIRIGGTYDHPTFGLDLNDKRAQVRPLHPTQDKK